MIELLNNKFYYRSLLTKLQPESGSMLFNLLIIMGVVTILFTLSIPLLRQYQPNIELSTTVRNLTSDLRYAQQLTISEQKIHVVELDDISNSYQILKFVPATTTIKYVSLPTNIVFQTISGFTDNQVSFNAYGAASEDGQIILANIVSRTKTIIVKPSGYVYIE